EEEDRVAGHRADDVAEVPRGLEIVVGAAQLPQVPGGGGAAVGVVDHVVVVAELAGLIAAGESAFIIESFHAGLYVLRRGVALADLPIDLIHVPDGGRLRLPFGRPLWTEPAGAWHVGRGSGDVVRAVDVDVHLHPLVLAG